MSQKCLGKCAYPHKHSPSGKTVCQLDDICWLRERMTVAATSGLLRFRPMRTTTPARRRREKTV